MKKSVFTVFFTLLAVCTVFLCVPAMVHAEDASEPPATTEQQNDEQLETSKGIFGSVKDILTKVRSIPEDIADKLSSSFTDLKDGITGKLNEVKQGIANIATAIGNKLKELFVPDEIEAITDIKNTVNEKFPFISQLADIFDGLFSFSDSSTPPTFTFSWKGADAPIIDFAPFVSLRTPIHVIIALFVWIRFIMWLVDYVPKLLGGIGG